MSETLESERILRAYRLGLNDSWNDRVESRTTAEILKAARSEHALEKLLKAKEK